MFVIGFKDPKALERLVKMINGNLEFVNRDLKLYKNILTKLSAAKEMMKELTEREKKRAVEREASKAKADIAEESQQTWILSQRYSDICILTIHSLLNILLGLCGFVNDWMSNQGHWVKCLFKPLPCSKAPQSHFWVMECVSHSQCVSLNWLAVQICE